MQDKWNGKETYAKTTKRHPSCLSIWVVQKPWLCLFDELEDAVGNLHMATLNAHNLISSRKTEWNMTWQDMAEHGSTRAWLNKQAIRDNGILASSLSGFLSGCQRSCKNLHCRPSATYLGAT